jgi:hypothetical protein
LHCNGQMLSFGVCVCVCVCLVIMHLTIAMQMLDYFLSLLCSYALLRNSSGAFYLLGKFHSVVSPSLC